MPASGNNRRSTGYFGDAAVYDAWFETAAGKYAWALEEEVLADACGDANGALILDVGSGTGRCLARFAAAGARPVGLDPSPGMLAYSRARLGTGAALVRGRGEKLPFRDNVCEVVTLVTSLEAMADAGAALEEARRVCRRRLVVAVLNAWSLSALCRRLKRNFGPSLFRGVRFYNPFELKRKMRRSAGVAPEAVSTLHLFPFGAGILRGLFTAVERWLTQRGSLLGAFLVAWADIPATRTGG